MLGITSGTDVLRFFRRHSHWLFRGFGGDEILASYVGIIVKVIRIPIKQPVFHGKYTSFFSLLTVFSTCQVAEKQQKSSGQKNSRW